MRAGGASAWLRRTELALALVGALCSCSNDLDALVCGPRECPAERDAGSEPPWLPALPDEDVQPACTACAKDKCSDARDSCREDDACLVLLRCKAKCSDPACLEACEASNPFSVWYNDYFSCVLSPALLGGRCSVECASGENWDCKGRYAFGPVPGDAYEVEWRFVGQFGPDDPMRGHPDYPPLAGATVRACGGTTFDVCLQDAPRVWDRATIGAYGDAKLTLRGHYDGYLQITGGAPVERAAVYDRPTTGSQRRDTRFIARNVRNLVRPGEVIDVGFPIDGPDRTNVLALQLDCLALPSAGVTFAVAGEGQPDAAYFGLDGTAFSTEHTLDTGSGVLGVGLDAEVERVVIVEGQRWDDREILSARSVRVGRGWSTQVALLPLERGD